jgi:hypothetical protein
MRLSMCVPVHKLYVKRDEHSPLVTTESWLLTSITRPPSNVHPGSTLTRWRINAGGFFFALGDHANWSGTSRRMVEFSPSDSGPLNREALYSKKALT